MYNEDELPEIVSFLINGTSDLPPMMRYSGGTRGPYVEFFNTNLFSLLIRLMLPTLSEFLSRLLGKLSEKKVSLVSSVLMLKFMDLWNRLSKVSVMTSMVV